MQAALPPNPLTQSDDDPFEQCQPMGVALEMESDVGVDMNSKTVATLNKVVEDLRAPEESAETVCGGDVATVTTGSAVDQWQPTFILSAYAFLFPFHIGAPDLRKPGGGHNQDRRKDKDMVVDFKEDWMPCILRRAEGQFRRDITFPFALWNLAFRQTINMGGNMSTVTRLAHRKMVAECGDSGDEEAVNATGEDEDAMDVVSAGGKAFRDAAINILRCLDGEYVTPTGATQKVNGDLQKVRYCSDPGLSTEGQALLTSLQATLRRVPGTQEIRSIMRSEINAMRIACGTPIMVTFSPNERHSTLMVRLSRVRRSDPLAQHGKRDEAGVTDGLRWGGLDEPKIEEAPEGICVGEVTMAALLDKLPDSKARCRILAKDPLACAHGFRLLCKIALSELFGARICNQCPNCNCRRLTSLKLYCNLDPLTLTCPSPSPSA